METDADAQARLDDAERRATAAEARIDDLQAELVRTAEWRRATLIAVVAVALLAILMLGVVAFNAVDDAQVGVDRAALALWPITS